MSEFNSKYVDYSETKFNKLIITEDIYDKTYEYTCTYDLNIKYTGVQTDDKQFNRLCDTQVFHSSDRLVSSRNSRPDCLKTVINAEDDKEGTVDYAIRDWLDSFTRESQKFDAIIEIFGVNLPQKIFDNALYNGKFEISSGDRKLKSIEFDYRRPEIDKITLIYDDGKSFTVETKNKITNKDTDGVVPGMTLPELYSNVDDWLQEDYEGTVEMLDEIFGFDVITLKGAVIV